MLIALSFNTYSNTFTQNEDHNNDFEVTDSIDSKYATYITKHRDTLMLIAFKAYTNYSKWKTILRDNPQLGNSTALTKGMEIKLRKPLFLHDPPKGRPYLIRKDDSLSKISNKVYGQWQLWPKIYENNRDQIKDPNLIFAGFTLFYPSEYIPLVAPRSPASLY